MLLIQMDRKRRQQMRHSEMILRMFRSQKTMQIQRLMQNSSRQILWITMYLKTKISLLKPVNNKFFYIFQKLIYLNFHWNKFCFTCFI